MTTYCHYCHGLKHVNTLWRTAILDGSGHPVIATAQLGCNHLKELVTSYRQFTAFQATVPS